MANSKDNSPITPDSVLASVKEMFAVSRKEFLLQLKKSEEKQDKRSADFDRLLKESEEKRVKSIADFDRLMKESQEEQAKRSADFDRRLKESQEEQAKRSAALDVKLAQLTEQVSGISKSNGLFAEDYFFSSFKKDDIGFFGEKFDKVVRGRGTVVEDEYDFVLINGKMAGIVEVKYRARKDDIAKALKKVSTFKKNFPEYSNHKIYLAIAALTINGTLERECLKQGIAVIKEVGDKVVVYNQNLKAF